MPAEPLKTGQPFLTVTFETSWADRFRGFRLRVRAVKEEDGKQILSSDFGKKVNENHEKGPF